MEDERSRCVLMFKQTRKEFYKKFLREGLPIELPSSSGSWTPYALTQKSIYGASARSAAFLKLAALSRALN
jgi:hypothetical protein